MLKELSIKDLLRRRQCKDIVGLNITFYHGRIIEDLK